MRAIEPRRGPRRSSSPTLAAGGEALSALEQWADDYVTLPVEMRELVARAHALVRRKGMAGASVGVSV